MRENFLHHLWKFKKFETRFLSTVIGESVELISVGHHNHDSGPDFFNAKIKIADQLWAGNVEIHVRSSDWFVHKHETDLAYDSIILHVVWQHDAPVFRIDNTEIPTLELKKYVNQKLLTNYQDLFNRSKRWINCENDFASIDDFVLQNWMDRLFFERLERKSLEVESLLLKSNNNWEAVLFKMLAKNFGLKVNGEAFLSMARSIDHSILRKQQQHLLGLEALFFGQSGLLDEAHDANYFLKLKDEYEFLKKKFKLSNEAITPLKFFRLRPSNFPTIRLSQMANLFHRNRNLFSQVITTNSLQDFYKLFSVGPSTYWERHYTFSKASQKSSKKLTTSFIDLLLINTVIPIKFSHAKHIGKLNNEIIMQLVQQINSEKNNIIHKFNRYKKVSQSAIQSQALIELKSNYCNKNKCLQCAIGSALLSQNN